MPFPEAYRTQRPSPRGFTLLEVLVTLILIGVAAALVAPAFRDLPRTEKDELDVVIDAAKRVAVRNASTVTLAFAADGRWGATESNGASLVELPGGTLAQTGVPLVRLRVSPLGGCSMDGVPPAQPTLTFDPVRCRLRGVAP
jgi:prepilin-type N-terminal cleavage/methylation domain-containing protein